MYRRILVMSQIVLAFAVIAHAENLIVDGDFSTVIGSNLLGWTPSTGQTTTCAGSFPGSNLCAVELPGEGSVTQSISGMNLTDSYALSFWLLPSTTFTDALDMFWDGSLTTVTQGITDASGYVQYTTFVTSTGSDSLQFMAESGNTGTLNLTGVSLEDTVSAPEPGTWLITGLGFLGLSFKRSRKSS